MQWLIFLPQLPASPSTLRVMVWRRMRDVGALGLQNGVWLLPDTAEHKQLAGELRGYLEDHQASCHLFAVTTLDAQTEAEVIERLRNDRDEEYAEFIERCDVLLDDLAQETEQGKFSFAELEEAEVDLTKLEGWWEKCTARDFVTGARREQALGKLETCRAAYQAFAGQVYAKHGVEDSQESQA